MAELNSEGLRLTMLSSKTQELMENLHDFLEQKGKTRLQLKMGMAQFYNDSKLVSTLSERLTREGADTGVASPALERAVEHYAVGQIVERIGTTDALSKIAAGTYSEKKRAHPWWLYNETAFIRGLEGVPTKKGPMFGQFGVIDGHSTGRGKTGFGVRLGEIALAKGYAFVTNIDLGEVPEEWDARVMRVTRLSALIRACIALKKQGLKIIIILDEALFFFGRQDPSSQEVRDFDKFARWIRKLSASLVLVVHDFESDVPEKFKGFVKTRFTKTALKDLVAVILADHYKLRLAVTDVPDADKITYETESKGAFTMDVDILALSDYLTRHLEVDQDADEDDLMIRYLDDPEAAAAESGLDTSAKPPSLLEVRVRHVVEHVDAFTTPKGQLDIGAVMNHFSINRGPARDVADIAARRAGMEVSREGREKKTA